MKDRRNFLGMLGVGTALAVAGVAGNVATAELKDTDEPLDRMKKWVSDEYIAIRRAEAIDAGVLSKTTAYPQDMQQLSEIRRQREEIDDLRDELSRGEGVKDFMLDQVRYLQGELSRVTKDWNNTREMAQHQQRRANNYEDQFKFYLIEAELWSAAVTCDAFMPERVVNILREHSKVLDILDANGQPTGNHQVIVNLHDFHYDTGEPFVNRLPVLEAVQRFRFLCPGLFKANVCDGIERLNTINWKDNDGQATKVRLLGIWATIIVRENNIQFISLPFGLINEIKSFKGVRRIGFSNKPMNIWIIDNCKANRDRLDYLHIGEYHEYKT
jgi:hypothetical protein